MATFTTPYIFGFATAICVVCSVAVAGVSLSLSERQEVNRQRDIRQNVLQALGLPEGGGLAQGEEIDRLWEERVEQHFITPEGEPATLALDLDEDGALDRDDLIIAQERVDGPETPPLLGLYVRQDPGGDIGALAVPLIGNGLWGPLNGYLALDPTGSEVTGATFFAPKETPGLGAEIQEAPFEEQWVGKSVRGEEERYRTIRVVKGKPTDLCPDELEHCVEGVSGATITSRGVDEMVALALEWYEPYLRALDGAPSAGGKQ
jgi:Na+-transporting NADH:ubiquinone oxidoreductase subunit C